MLKKSEISGLFLIIKDRLSKSVASIVPPDEIEDIVQETYVRVCQFEEKHTINYPRTFMLRTAKNLALDHVKRAESKLVDGVETEDEFFIKEQLWGNETHDKVVSNDEFALFCKAVRTLPRQCRKAFVLKKVYGYTHKEIAKKLNISDRTVEKHVATGITRCARFMKKHTSFGENRVIKKVHSSSKRVDSETQETNDGSEL